MIRMPAEWEPQDAVLIAWPHQSGDFVHNLEAVENTYIYLADTISQYQHLVIVCRDNGHEYHARSLLPTRLNICYVQAVTNDIWVRDTVCITVEKDGQPLLLNFRFNGWGQKYPYHEDDALNHKLLAQFPFKDSTHSDINFILEAGSIESDGAGTLLTTQQCLLNSNRNRGLSKNDIETQLTHHLGAKRVFWLDQENLAGDDTDAHIDTLVRFCSPKTIAYTSCEDSHDRHYQGLKRMSEQLSAFKTQDGSSYELMPLPLPKPIFDDENQRLPANYANFLIINGAVLLPAYNDPMDTVVAERMQTCFPEREIILIPSLPLVRQYGSLHCMTMNFPKNSLYLK